jgi:hypothetical protein
MRQRRDRAGGGGSVRRIWQCVGRHVFRNQHFIGERSKDPPRGQRCRRRGRPSRHRRRRLRRLRGQRRRRPASTAMSPASGSPSRWRGSSHEHRNRALARGGGHRQHRPETCTAARAAPVQPRPILAQKMGKTAAPLARPRRRCGQRIKAASSGTGEWPSTCPGDPPPASSACPPSFPLPLPPLSPSLRERRCERPAASASGRAAPASRPPWRRRCHRLSRRPSRRLACTS